MRGRWLARTALVCVLATLGAGTSVATASAATHGHSKRAGQMATAVLHAKFKARGKYLVIVWVRARGKHTRKVKVTLAGQRTEKVTAYPWWGGRAYYTLRVTRKRLLVRALGKAPAVQMRASVILKKSLPGASTTTVDSGTSSQPASTTTTTTTATPTPTPTPAPAPAPPPATSPYTNLVWQDNFQSDFTAGGSVAGQLPPPKNWALDNWGGCGGGTLSTTNDGNNVGAPASQNAYLTANGLAMTALPNGHGGYSSAQIDSAPNGPDGYSFTDGEIEASIQMPAGQGLCPAFWLLSDNPVPGTSQKGEIDVVEAPSFGATPQAYFTLHGPTAGTTNTQEWEGLTPPSFTTNLSAGFHTYGLIWTPTWMTWTIDGVAYASAAASTLTAGSSWANYESGKFHIIMDLAVGGWPCGVAGTCQPQTSPQTYTMTVQWVKVYQ
jgi:beta-glucanase (GH16 family)